MSHTTQHRYLNLCCNSEFKTKLSFLLNIHLIESLPTESGYSDRRELTVGIVINVVCHLFLVPGSTEHGRFALANWVRPWDSEPVLQ